MIMAWPFDIKAIASGRKQQAARGVIKYPVKIRIQILVEAPGGRPFYSLEPSRVFKCNTELAVEYLRFRLLGLFEELDGTRVAPAHLRTMPAGKPGRDDVVVQPPARDPMPGE
jgi:hypothetical protein